MDASKLIFLVLVVTSVHSLKVKADEPSYGFEPSIGADKAIRDAASNFTIERGNLLSLYTGVKAETCKKALNEQPWYDDTSKALDSAVSDALQKLKELDTKFTTYIKNCGFDHVCYTLAKSLGTHEVNKLRDDTLTSINKIKDGGLDSVKSFIEKCIV